MCNNGCEFLRRFELTLTDIVHLALFNMTVFFAKKYFDLDSEILPYINRNAFLLQLPARVSALEQFCEERLSHSPPFQRLYRTKRTCYHTSIPLISPFKF